MRRTSLLAAVLLVTAACGGSSGSPTTTTTTQAATSTTAATTSTTSLPATTATTAATTTTGAPIAAGMLGLYSVMFEQPSVAIYNGTEGTIDLTGYWLVQGRKSAEIPSIQLPPGAYLQLDLGATFFFPIPGSLTVDGVIQVGNLDPADGEIALFSSDAFDDPASLVSYVEWGQSGHRNDDVAIAAGAWEDGWFVETTDATTAITYFPDTSTSGESGWSAF